MIHEAPHPAFPLPANKDARIWRYLDVQKFEWLARERRLFMPNAAHLGDRLEGTQPSGHDDWWKSLASAASTDGERENIQHNHELLARFAAAFRTRYYVSCWHTNADENPEMWMRYTKSSESVVIQSTYERLRAALPPFVGIGLVRYIDYASERLPTLNMFEYVTHKNTYFAYEQELRAVAMHPVIEGLDQQHFREHRYESEQNPSFLVYAPPVDLSAMVESVMLHPSAPEKFAQHAALLCQEARMSAPQRSMVELPVAS